MLAGQPAICSTQLPGEVAHKANMGTCLNPSKLREWSWQSVLRAMKQRKYYTKRKRTAEEFAEAHQKRQIGLNFEYAWTFCIRCLSLSFNLSICSLTCKPISSLRNVPVHAWVALRALPGQSHPQRPQQLIMKHILQTAKYMLELPSQWRWNKFQLSILLSLSHLQYKISSYLFQLKEVTEKRGWALPTYSW